MPRIPAPPSCSARRRLLLAPLPLLGLLVASCASSGAKSSSREVQPYASPAAAVGEEVSIGKYLTDLSASINAWASKTWTASGNEDRRKQDLLELHIMERAHRRKMELIQELEAGPVRNRVIAAAALGFTREPDVLSPLLAALDDPERKVVANALLGLALLQSADTPPSRVCALLANHPDSRVRWSAAYCARSIVQVGVREECLTRSARLGLSDEEPMVRSQCALLLAQLDDAESLDGIEALLYDDIPLVSAAASRSIRVLGQSLPQQKGRAARALARAMRDGDRKLRLRVLPDLVQLSGRDHQLDAAAWMNWAASLP